MWSAIPAIASERSLRLLLYPLAIAYIRFVIPLIEFRFLFLFSLYPLAIAGKRFAGHPV